MESDHSIASLPQTEDGFQNWREFLPAQYPLHWIDDPELLWMNVQVALVVRDAVNAAFSRSEEILDSVQKTVDKLSNGTPPEDLATKVQDAMLVALAGTVPLQKSMREPPDARANEKICSSQCGQLSEEHRFRDWLRFHKEYLETGIDPDLPVKGAVENDLDYVPERMLAMFPQQEGHA